MSIRSAVCYSLSLNSQDVLAHLRLIEPFHLAGINIIDGIVNNQPDYEAVLKGDIVVIQRDFPRMFEDYQSIVKIAKQEKKPIVFDLDDLLFCLPENHPARESQHYVSSFIPMFQALRDADMITVSTRKLKEILDQYHNNVVVLPNFFLDALWQLRPPVKKHLKNEVLTIGYMGGNTHEADLEYIAPVLLNIAERYPGRVNFHFLGMEPHEKLRFLDQATWTTQYLHSYKNFVSFFKNQSIDIFIAPLLDNIFNRCKSPIKFFDYSALGATGVFSHIEPYLEIVEHEKNGLLAASLDEWMEGLVNLIENHDLRYMLATNAQATIRAKYLMSKNAFRWQETFQFLSNLSIDKRNEDSVNILAAVNTQISQALNKDQQQIQLLNTRLQEQEKLTQATAHQLNATAHQLNEITTSKAWRFATAIRRVRVVLFPPGSWRSRLVSKMLILPMSLFKKYIRSSNG